MNTCALNLLGTAHKLIESEIYRTRHFLFVCVCVCGCCSGLQTAAAAADLAANRTQLLLLIVLVLFQTGFCLQSQTCRRKRDIYWLIHFLVGKW